MRKTKFATDEIYHIFNRGVDKRSIFKTEAEIDRFLLGMRIFNTIEPIGSIYEYLRVESQPGKIIEEPPQKLVDFITYGLNKNHFHFQVKQLVDKGVEKLMHRLGISHTNFFNIEYHRTGSLFEGKFKDRHVDSNEYLLLLSVYINLNFQVHSSGNLVPKLFRTSWWEYIDQKKDTGFCQKDIILDQFNSRADYLDYAQETLADIVARRQEDQNLNDLFLEF